MDRFRLKAKFATHDEAEYLLESIEELTELLRSNATHVSQVEHGNDGKGFVIMETNDAVDAWLILFGVSGAYPDY